MSRGPEVFRAAAASVLAVALMVSGCDRPSPMEGESPTSVSLQGSRGPAGPAASVGEFDSEVAVVWFQLAYDLTRSERLSPPVASRAFGYAGVTLYEALVPGMHGYRSLAGQLNDLVAVPGPKDRQLYWPAVANAAMGTIMRQLYPSKTSQDAIRTLEQAFVEEFKSQVPARTLNASIRQGNRVALAIQAWSTGDGYDQFHNCAYAPPVGTGLWEPTLPGFASALEPCWAKVRPFVLTSGAACNPGPPPAYSEDPTSAFYQEAKEVWEVVNNLTDEQLAIAVFWADDPGKTGTPPGHSISIAGQILMQMGAGLDVAAETYAKVGIGVADAFISCWWTKYNYNLLRPITYVHNVIDATWTIPLNTPPFPEYTSGHSVQSGSASQILTDLFGDVAFTDHTHDAVGLPARSFTSFFEAADEAAISRLYGGIHYRSAIDLGVDQGKCIGQVVGALEFKRSRADAIAD